MVQELLNIGKRIVKLRAVKLRLHITLLLTVMAKAIVDNLTYWYSNCLLDSDDDPTSAFGVRERAGHVLSDLIEKEVCADMRGSVFEHGEDFDDCVKQVMLEIKEGRHGSDYDRTVWILGMPLILPCGVREST